MSVPFSYFRSDLGLGLGLGLQGMPISLGFWEWGCLYHCDIATLQTKRTGAEMRRALFSGIVTGAALVVTVPEVFANISRAQFPLIYSGEFQSWELIQSGYLCTAEESESPT